MKKQENEVRRKMVVTRMNQNEFDRLETFRKQTTERSISEYVRAITLRKPIIVKYRNQSADDFLRQILEQKKDLNGIGNNFNLAVHKLHILEKIPEFREWISQYDTLHKKLVEKVEEIKLRMNQLYKELLQEYSFPKKGRQILNYVEQKVLNLNSNFLQAEKHFGENAEINSY